MIENARIIGAVFRLLALAIFVLLNAGSGAWATGATGKGSDFAFVLGRGETESQQLLLVGKFKAGTKLTMLHPGTEKTCAGTTSANTEYIESANAYLTEIVGSCSPKFAIGVALLQKNVVDYKQLHLERLTEPAKVDKIDQTVRKSEVLSVLRTKAQSAVPGDLRALDGVTPKVYRLSLPKAEIFVAAYNSEHSRNEDVYVPESGPKVIMVNGRAYPLTGWCSFATLDVFRLNGQYFIHSGSRCCGCGIVGMELFRVTPKGPVEVLSDYSLSD